MVSTKLAVFVVLACVFQAKSHYIQEEYFVEEPVARVPRSVGTIHEEHLDETRFETDVLAEEEQSGGVQVQGSPQAALHRLGRAIHEDPQVEYFQESLGEEPHNRARRQVFGGVSHLPGGGRTQTIGGQAGPAWGSLSQSSNNRGFTSPITVAGGLGHTSPAGHGLAGSFAAQPGIGGQASLRGQVGLLNTPSHQVTAFGQHDRAFDKNVHFVGPATNSAGLNYLNKNNGAGAFVSGSHTPGFPNSGTVGGNIPLVTANGGRTTLQATGQSSFAQGMKPNHQVGLQFNHNF